MASKKRAQNAGIINMKLKEISAVLIWSEDYKKLVQWYKDNLDLKVIEELTHPEDTGVGLSLGKSYFWVGQHS